MSEFKRGDRVEVKGGDQWWSALYLGMDGQRHCVSLDVHLPDNVIKAWLGEIRHPRKTVKVMMQDWVCPDASGDPEKAWVTSRAAAIPHDPIGMHKWQRSGEPYEREFFLEVPQ